MLEAKNYRSAFAAHALGAAEIERLLAEQPDSTLAKQLSIGSTNIAGAKLDDLAVLGQDLRQLAEAERNFLQCAVALTINTKDEADRGFYLISAAEISANSGDTNTTTHLLDLAARSVETKTNRSSRAHAYERIAEVHELVGSESAAKAARANAMELILSTEVDSPREAYAEIYVLISEALHSFSEGDTARGEELTQLAIQAMARHDEDLKYSPSLGYMVGRYNDAGRFAEAIQILGQGDRRRHSFSYQIRTMATTNRPPEQLARLVELAMTIEEEYDRDRTLSTLAALYAARGHFSSAKMLQSVIKNSFCHNQEQWISAVREHAINRRINAAFLTVDLFPQDDDTVEALLEIAAALSAQGHTELAEHTMMSALNIARTGSYMPDYEMIGRVAVAYAEQGHAEQAEELLSYHTDKAQAIERPWSKANALNDLAAARLELNQRDNAIELLLEARTALAERKDKDNGLLLKHLAENLTRAGKPHAAYETAGSIEDTSRYKEDAYGSLAVLFVKANEHQLVNESIQKVRADYARSILIDDVVEAYIARDQPEYALECTEWMTKAYEVSGVLTAVTIHHATNDALDLAIDTLGLFTNTSSQISALIDLAEEAPQLRPLDNKETEALTGLVLDAYPLDEFWTQHGMDRE